MSRAWLPPPALANAAGRECPSSCMPDTAGARELREMATPARIGQLARRRAAPHGDDSGCTSRRRQRHRSEYRQA
jgi:hypothetical protein